MIYGTFISNGMSLISLKNVKPKLGSKVLLFGENKVLTLSCGYFLLGSFTSDNLFNLS